MKCAVLFNPYGHGFPERNSARDLPLRAFRAGATRMRPVANKEGTLMPLILWLLGVPLGLIVILWLVGVV
jgi:hypothetical protein